MPLADTEGLEDLLDSYFMQACLEQHPHTTFHVTKSSL
jgi:hypothetical protein